MYFLFLYIYLFFLQLAISSTFLLYSDIPMEIILIIYAALFLMLLIQYN